MNANPTHQRTCEILKRLMFRLPEAKGFSLKEAGRLCKVNLYKYRSNGSLPMTLSLLSYGEAFKIDADWIIRIASMVAGKRITEDQAIEILSRWDEFKPACESATEVAIKQILNHLDD